MHLPTTWRYAFLGLWKKCDGYAFVGLNKALSAKLASVNTPAKGLSEAQDISGASTRMFGGRYHVPYCAL